MGDCICKAEQKTEHLIFEDISALCRLSSKKHNPKAAKIVGILYSRTFSTCVVILEE